MPTEAEYEIALTLTPQIGCVAAKTLVNHFGNATDIFKARKSSLAALEGIGSVRADAIKAFSDFETCRREVEFCHKHHLELLFLTHEHYPKRLLNCYDSPTVLYYKGEANLNASKVATVVGTRLNSEYGRQCTAELMEALASHQVLIVSGLAFGTDTIAHREALRCQLPTVACLAHGLHTIYPAENKKLATQMLEQQGGLLTEYRSGEPPDRHNFPTRNRIAAGMADVTIVIETDIEGGSMITAELANGYNRDVMAYPGKTTDPKSRGCNHLIKTNKAALITCGQDVVNAMNWAPAKAKKPVQRALFIELTETEQLIYNQLLTVEQIHIDELQFKCQLPASALSATLLTLELQGLVSSLPGKMYRLV